MACLYSIIAVVMTWPLAAHLGSRLASDLGDPAFNSWVLAWDAGQMLKAIGGDVGALAQYWNGNIFHPEPLTLAYSEHLTAQALQILPIYAATGNILIAYNVLFISTFALSGLAVYLLVRDLTSRPLAAVLAGLAFAYAPYRMGQFSHVQVLSSYWMPFALLGFHRYFARVTARQPGAGRARALAGAAAALVLQHWSCGYYMLFFAPFVVAYCLYEIAQRRIVRDGRVWIELGVAAIVVALATWPFVRPYFALRDLGTLGVRSYGEIAMFSADAHAFVTASSATRWLGRWMTGYFRPEGEGFPGVTILLFATGGLVWGGRRLVARTSRAVTHDWQVVVMAIAGLAAAASAGLMVWFFVQGQLTLHLGNRTVVYQYASPVLAVAVVSGVIVIGLATLVRRVSARASSDAFGFYAVAAIAAALLALGPRMEAAGRGLGPGPYLWLLEYVPGFDGLRVPARLLMLVSLFLAVLAGIGAAAFLGTKRRRFAAACAVAGMAGVMFEAWSVPIALNAPVLPAEGLSRPPAPAVGRRLNPIYEVVRRLPDPVVLAEFPFGDTAYELMATFYSGYHRRPLVNGYSGFFPQSYQDLAGFLKNAPENPDVAADALHEAGVTHVLVHEGAYLDGRGRDLTAWLLSKGARPVAASGSDKLFALK